MNKRQSREKRVILVPTYNEAEGVGDFLEKVLPYVQQAGARLIFIDDGSPDGTGEILEEKSRRNPSIGVIHRKEKMGLGPAYIEGFQWAFDNGYSEIVQMDSDLSHQPGVLPRIFDLLGSHDLVIGSRYVAGGGLANWPWYRRLLSRGGNLYAHTLLGVPIRDLTTGFNGWRAPLLKRVVEVPMAASGYSFLIETKYRAHMLGAKYIETPIVFVEREDGSSKMTFGIILEGVLKVAGMALTRIAGRSHACSDSDESERL